MDEKFFRLRSSPPASTTSSSATSSTANSPAGSPYQPRRRRKASSSATPSDKFTMTIIPLEFCNIHRIPDNVLIKFLLKLDNITDIFSNCSPVCQRWNYILHSDVFIEALLRREFGDEAARDFVRSTPNAVTKFKKLLFQQNSIFSQFGKLFRASKGRRVDVRPITGENSDGDITSVHEFVLLLRAGDAKCKRRHLPCCFIGDRYRWWLVNVTRLLPQLPQLVDILRMPLVIGSSEATSSSSWFEPCLIQQNRLDDVAIYDEKMALLQQHVTSDDICLILSNYPKNTTFLAFNGLKTFTIRLILPSMVPKMRQTARDAFFLAELEKATL